MPESNEQLAELRQQINQIDREIIIKLAARLEAARKIGEIKKANDLPITDAEREAELAKIHAEECQKLGLDESKINALFKLIIALSKTVQK
jgi:chorismate mutase